MMCREPNLRATRMLASWAAAWRRWLGVGPGLAWGGGGPWVMVALLGSLTTVASAKEAEAVSDVAEQPGAPHQIIPGPQRGTFTLRFENATEQSQLSAISKRFKAPLDSVTSAYDLTQETFEVFVPSNYEPGQPFGLIVWISASDQGQVFDHWQPVLEEHRLIWIAANRSGNQHELQRRCALALDASEQMAQRYSIDPQRAYLMGFSGGGRCASMVALTYPHVFNGGFFICGVNYFRDLPVDDGRAYLASFPSPVKQTVDQGRYVVLTGDNDFNLASIQRVHAGFVEDEFQFITYIQVPDMRHDIPEAKWFERGIAALDQPLTQGAEALSEKAQALEKQNRFGEAWKHYTLAAIRGKNQPFVAEAWAHATLLRGRMNELIRQIRDAVEQQQYANAQRLIQEIRVRYRPLADEDVDLQRLSRAVQAALGH